MNLDHHLNRMSTMPSTVLGIDPGNEQSAYVIIDHTDRRPLDYGKVPNDWLLCILRDHPLVQLTAIEMVASYGMPVGREVFETCVWIGRFYETIRTRLALGPLMVYRQPIKLHHCGSSRAKDSNITQALVDRFAPGQPNHGKGTKAAPGWFYGFKADIWQSYALAVYVADTTPPTVSVPAAATPCAAAGTDTTTPTTSGAPATQGEGIQGHRNIRVAEHLRELTRTLYGNRQEANGQAAIDDTLTPDLKDVLAAGQQYAAHPFLPTDAADDNPTPGCPRFGWAARCGAPS